MDCQYKIDYVKRSPLFESEAPFMLFIDIPKDHTDQRRSNVEFESHETRVRNLRDQNEGFSLETHGFTLRDSAEAAALNDTDDFEAKYIPLVKVLLEKEFPDSDEVLFTGWRVRNAEEKQGPQMDAEQLDLNNQSEYLMPAANAHTDTSPMGGIHRVNGCCEKNKITRKVARAQIVNVWRPFDHPVYDWPLAICDGSTVEGSDLVEVQQVYPDFMSSPMFLQYNPEQRWYYVREQKPSEILIFKQFDSAAEANVRFCPHVAFFDPESPQDAPCRKSVEVRAVVLTYA